ncbi:hypothetical protein VTN77DRAFT_3228 [Rasamsonia byssochlamydoides]|uniref:uncharacterized protein n=1 Tax=Rasamsonia byssochlamydoides TaxID=89139 RepID=UPI003742149B
MTTIEPENELDLNHEPAILHNNNININDYDEDNDDDIIDETETPFPTLAHLPSAHNIDVDFYDTADGTFYRPTRHWCFLAEIVDIQFFVRLMLIVRDRAGYRVPIHFYTDERGSDFLTRCCASNQQLQPQPGYTVAILYAHRYRFWDFSVGIRQEQVDSIKVRLSSSSSSSHTMLYFSVCCYG